ncbi:MAG TPA: YncE family protein [Acidimicrobiales bacterium]|nr:YncE family protein [Acidimicrobiales bacterium]
MPNCTGPEAAFIDEGALYSQLGYPMLSGYTTANYIDPLSPSFVYFVQFPNEGYDVPLGDLEVPMSTVCQGIGDAAARLGLDPSNYTLAAVSLNDAELNIAYPDTTASWGFYFARVYHGYWIYGTIDNGYSAAASVNAVTDDVYGVSRDNYSLSGQAPVQSLNVNSSQAIEIVHHTTMNKVPPAVANGTVDSINLRLATFYNEKGGAYPAIHAVNDTTQADELRLLWIVVTSAPNYAGYFVVDAVSGQVLEALAESTLPCGGGPCGTTTETETGVTAAPLFDQAHGLAVEPESFQVDGRAFGLNATYSVYVPNVVVMAPGTTGTLGLTLQGIQADCPPNQTASSGSQTVVTIQDCPTSYQVSPSTAQLPAGVSVSFSKPTVDVAAGATLNETMTISVSATAAQGTYMVFLQSAPNTSGVLGDYYVLSVWNGKGQWPVLPMLDVPLFSGDKQPIIVNGTAIFTYTITTYPVVERVQMTGSKAVAVTVDQARNLVFTEWWPLNGQGKGVGVSVVSGANDSILDTIDIPNATLPVTPVTMAFNPHSDQLYVPVTIADSGRLVVLDTVSMRVVGSIAVPAQAVAYNPVTNLIYVCEEGGGLTAVNASTFEPVASLGSGGTAVAVNPVTNTVYEANDNGMVNVVDGSTNTISASIDVGKSPDAIAVNSKMDTVYVANQGSNSLSVINGATNQVITTIPVGSSPYGVAVNPNTNMVFVSDTGSGSVVVIDGASNKPLYAISTDPEPLGIDLNASTGLVYVSSEVIAEIDVLSP